ncbi:MAG: hypothetical protein M3478_11960 [Planctomycetota bacterium]|nr:hypothetical protein [Planctomycetota bacterium]
MNQTAIWNDGRSGVSGCFAGNVALAGLQRVKGPIEKVKGTCFEGPSTVLIGRVCSSDGYLTEPVLHWANTSWDQHQEMKARANERGKDLAYLFVTASKDPPVVRYWNVPGKVVEAAMAAREKNQVGATCAIHITGDDKEHFLGATKVTEFHEAVTLAGPEAASMERTFSAAKRGGSRGDMPAMPRRAIAESAVRYAIPVSGGRAVQVEIPSGLTSLDLDRIQAWFAISSDALVSPPSVIALAEDDDAREQRQWLRDQVQAGLNQLARGQGVDGGAAFERILARRRNAQEVAP